MREGAFALIDCLGFKGVWQRSDSSSLIKKLRHIGKEIQNELDLYVKPYWYATNPIVVRPTLLSDSVAISLQYEDCYSDSEIYKSYLVWLLCASTIKVLDRFLEGDPHLVLRGCVTYGGHESEGNFIFGPAVDDAAENMEISQGAFVWLFPEAATMYKLYVKVMTRHLKRSSLEDWVKKAIVEKRVATSATESSRTYNANKSSEELGVEITALANTIKASLGEPIMVDPYRMPLKVGGQLQCLVLNPLAFHETPKKRDKVIQHYTKAMSSNHLDVLLKRQNTLDFLSKAKEIWDAHSTNYATMINSVDEKHRAANRKK